MKKNKYEHKNPTHNKEIFDKIEKIKHEISNISEVKIKEKFENLIHKWTCPISKELIITPFLYKNYPLCDIESVFKIVTSAPDKIFKINDTEVFDFSEIDFELNESKFFAEEILNDLEKFAENLKPFNNVEKTHADKQPNN